MKSPVLFLSAFLVASVAHAQAPTWSTDVAPILYNKCASCHRTGGIAPFSLTTYAQASGMGQSIKFATGTGHMPPWPPDPTYNRLANERMLSPDEKAKIAAWVDAGTPQGNPAAAPPQPTFPADGDLPGTPDLTLQIPTYTSQSASADIYRCFVLPTGQTASKFITALEAVPGNRGIVHHVLVFADTTGVSTQMDALDPGPGYTSFGGIGTNNAILLGGWVPGTNPIQFPSGFGVKLPQSAKIVVQIHYPAGSIGQKDSTRLRLYFSPTNAMREVAIIPVLNHAFNISPALHIPANTTKNFTEHYFVPTTQNLSLIGVAPHMHLIGRSIKAYGVGPAGDTVKYISIPDWDFHWQGFYLLRKIVKIQGGTHLWSEAFYDNTTANPHNPSTPPQTVNAGEGTTDEMMLTYFIGANYQPGDENIIIDSTTPVPLNMRGYYSGQMLLEPFPNPASSKLYVKCHLQNAETVSFELISLDGRLQRKLEGRVALPAGYSVREYELSSLPAGNYLLQMHTGAGIKTHKLTIVH